MRLLTMCSIMLLVMTSFILECSRCQSHCVQTITNIPTSQYNCADAHRRCRCPVIVFTAQLTPDDPDWHLLMKLLVRRCRLNVKKKKLQKKKRVLRPAFFLSCLTPPGIWTSVCYTPDVHNHIQCPDTPSWPQTTLKPTLPTSEKKASWRIWPLLKSHMNVAGALQCSWNHSLVSFKIRSSGRPGGTGLGLVHRGFWLLEPTTGFECRILLNVINPTVCYISPRRTQSHGL